MRQPIQPYQLEILLLPTRRFDVLRIRCNLRETTPLTRRIILELVALPLSIRLNFFIRNRLDILLPCAVLVVQPRSFVEVLSLPSAPHSAIMGLTTLCLVF